MLLRSRPRSEFEIRQRLKLKNYGDDIIENVVTNLKNTGDIDDVKFAKFWLDSRMRFNPVGDVVLKHELKLKGVSEAVIDTALDEKNKAFDEYEVALSMAAERFERLKKLDRRKAAKRLYDFLLRRGFKYENVRRVIETVINMEKGNG